MAENTVNADQAANPYLQLIPRPSAEDRARLRAALVRVGEVYEPIKVDADGWIIDGNTRWELIRELASEGVTIAYSVDVEWAVDKTPEEIREYAVSTNRDRSARL